MRTSIKKFHRFSGIVIAGFLLLHLSNHLFALGGPELHIKVMEMLRPVYRFWPVEFLLLLCVAFQVVSGLTLVFTKRIFKQPLYVVIQVVSGLYLAFFLIFHVRAVLMGRYLWHTDTNFYFAAGVANRYPEKLFFIPYYSLSLICIFAHLACVHYIRRKEQLSKSTLVYSNENINAICKRETFIISAGGAVITLLIMLSLTGVLYPITFH
ncbi:hypothetical protein DVR12_22835 [Chitinophaga silvatica]|uniref:Uncharacterized protein n=1 Tax=Chitinophaga silvatica TaxID=2282649 RepID=A0A3E1Y487_9BACT|nr:hypothetical protein [Chitinophaga silvatica]RFS19473.1 hypothetical protein DVR12_22835 [Chitinophaga silvatica]